ncbi:penicillin-binding transpeptidase domain-containing protein [Streptomyces sp. H10-C2]|uniref:penicillin-binding transpeptidase domain-containing protein n=1 Tax=unclassified Streptomyces TaxID=2593676 RepID=UPI0024B97E0E|nr:MULTISPECIES: penicillin-binding transpeptidase domain-containing protein [unclassified Streptomyces]MDJ0341385.1 penicillin-binding transpeptidase domain-containing protein [Streptomyces sp. PH10-H1]MDJ0370980.1 penicillin-binding transpeptidase domain-containing protein [Streptomyces sp. H10-C2]
MQRGAKLGIVGGVFAGILGIAGYGVYNVLDGLNSDTASASSPAGSAKNTSPPGAKEITDTAADFLAAWSSGDTAKAAGLTDSVQTATGALTAYKDKAHVSAVKFTPGTAVGTKVPFNAAATLTFEGKTSPWTYDSTLTVIRGTSGKPVVQWKAAVLHPKLTNGATLETGPAKKPSLDFTDRNDKVLDPVKYPSLGRFFTQLRDKYATKAAGGTPGIETWIAGADGSVTETLHVITKGAGSKFPTTLDADIQAAAEKAVLQRSGSAVTALDSRTGGILAVANNPATGQNLAFGAQIAPGSTFKVLTAAALLQKGIKPGDPVPCAQQYAAPHGKPYTNVEKSSNPQADFRWDFANSCNTGFVRLSGKIGPDTLNSVADNSFGIGPTWNCGVQCVEGKVPVGSGDDMTAEMIGQGQLQMNPLIVASIAATASTGSFHQPRMVPLDVIGAPVAKAGGLSSSVTNDLRSMMHTTAVSGTAAEAMSGLNGSGCGAKTGSAEAGATQPNGWFLGYCDNVAVASVVLNGGHGGDSAGPIVAAVLKAS